MAPGNDDSSAPDSASSAEVKPLLADVADQEKTATRPIEPASEEIRPFDFRNRTLLAPRELRKLRAHQEDFINALASRLSALLRAEFPLKLKSLQTISYQKLTESWQNPSHLVLFKLEPMRGVSILEIPLQLGLSIVDRLMGGRGEAPESVQELSEIERALLDQAVQIILGEWSNHWLKIKDLKPIVLGCESDGRFVQVAASETSMLVLSLETGFADSPGQIQLAFPYSSLEPLIAQLSKSDELVAAPAPQPAPVPWKWNPVLDEVCVPVTAEWPGLELAARTILNLKVGDTLPLDPQCAQNVQVRVGDRATFNGRLGTVAGAWAVELTAILNR